MTSPGYTKQVRWLNHMLIRNLINVTTCSTLTTFSSVDPHVWHEGKNQESDDKKNLIPMNTT